MDHHLHTSVARTLSCVLSGNQVALQIMNTSPTPVTIYKGMKLGEVTPRHNVLLVDQDQVVTAIEHEYSSPEINLDSTDLTESEKTELLGLLTKFSDLFAPRGGPVGQTAVVKHAILTEGPPIRQQMS